MAAWTPESELDPVNRHAVPVPLWRPDCRAIMISVVLSVLTTLAVLWALWEAALHFAWQIPSP